MSLMAHCALAWLRTGVSGAKATACIDTEVWWLVRLFSWCKVSVWPAVGFVVKSLRPDKINRLGLSAMAVAELDLSL